MTDDAPAALPAAVDKALDLVTQMNMRGKALFDALTDAIKHHVETQHEDYEDDGHWLDVEPCEACRHWRAVLEGKV